MNKLFALLLFTALTISISGQQKSVNYGNVLAGTDELGRSLPFSDETGAPRENRQVGLFYFLWQGDTASKTSETHWDLSKIVPQHPEVLNDFDNPAWGSTQVGRYYFWGEPIYGYYRGDDYWVHLRNIQLLTDAGVDFLVIDATNAIWYPTQSGTLMEAMEAVRKQGKTPPKIVFYTNTLSGKTMQNIYNEYYKRGAPRYYPECWYYLEGKPLIIGISKEAEDSDYQSFFTFRESQWPNEPQKKNGWPWIEFVRPQTIYTNNYGQAEIVNVSVCQHPDAVAGMGGAAFYGNKNNWGRSYRNGVAGNPETDIKYGYNFQEQWDFALKQDVPFIFITGWNEWIAGRWASTDGNPEHSYFCDAASPEFSRDIEPTRTAGINDNYYMQMTANIRRYKGIADVPLAKQQTISNLSDWNKVSDCYTDYIGDTKARTHSDAQSKPKISYTNGGRNDFHILKVAADKRQIYFYARTVEAITLKGGDAKLQLYIDADRSFATGWNGYDYRIDGGKTLLQFTDDKWVEAGKTDCVMEGAEMMIKLPLNLIKLQFPLDIEFKWSDNTVNDSDPLDWYINGDVAPGGRFNYIFKQK
ncbi:MAG: hypothetical protein LBS52_05085 [Dysgonamonadaceae bacterium]|jgi:hypothetical protein|nr:hypothetical protein [Dysgonamonadaceae bacterium]